VLLPLPTAMVLQLLQPRPQYEENLCAMAYHLS
jgi:hypothetical protein